jgi:SAM-dependent methyltransferase
MLLALDRSASGWRDGKVYEAGPSGPLSRYLANECPTLTTSFYLPDVPGGQTRDGMRSEDLENLTFDDESFDVVVTQDVLEHVLRPNRALAEIARVLRPNGLHIFTVPYTPTALTAARAKPGPDGDVVFLAPPEYHGDPLDPAGVLVITDWGNDLPDIVREASNLRTKVLTVTDTTAGIPDQVTIFVSRKSGSNPDDGDTEI